MFKKEWIVEGRFMLVDHHAILGKPKNFNWEMVAGPYFLASTARALSKRYTRFAEKLSDDDDDDIGLFISREYRVTKI